MGGRVFSENTETYALREIGLRHLSRREWRTFHDWKADVRDDFGQAGERRLFRLMRWLVQSGLAEKSHEMRDCSISFGQVYAYRKLKTEVPVEFIVSRCSLCGAYMTTLRTHISYKLHRRTGHDPLARRRLVVRRYAGGRRRYRPFMQATGTRPTGWTASAAVLRAA